MNKKPLRLTCSKRYDDLPFAHRQPNHDGHCAWIHGHNWSFEFEFEASWLDSCGFVIDFGKLKWLKEWLHERFDHTLLLNDTDPEKDGIIRGLSGSSISVMLAKILVVDDCSCEGLCAYLMEEVNKVVASHTEGRVRVRRVTVIEDSKNSATITYEN